MNDRARWMLLGTATVLIAVALTWGCGGGGSNTSCITGANGIPINVCATASPAGPSLQSIAICPGAPPSPTPIASSSASVSPTPTEALCPTPVFTAVPTATTVVFHAVGVFSDGSHQDVTNSSTTWTSSDTAVLSPNTSPPGTFFSSGAGCANVNAVSGGISASSQPLVDVLPAACPTPTP